MSSSSLEPISCTLIHLEASLDPYMNLEILESTIWMFLLYCILLEIFASLRKNVCEEI